MVITGFINRTSGCSMVENEPMKCTDCRGAGEVSELTLKMRRIGGFIKEGRHNLDLTLREQCRVIGVPLRFLNDIERGWIPTESSKTDTKSANEKDSSSLGITQENNPE